MPNKDTTPLSLYGNDREYLREQEKTNELLADIAGEEYESPGDIPNGKYVIQKRLLDAAQKKNELLESIAEGSGTISGANKLAIDYGTDVLSLKKGDEPIANSGVTLPAYGVSFDPTTGGLTLTKNGTAVQGQTVTIPNYGSPVGVTDSADMVDEGTIYLYEGTTGGGFTNGHFYYYDGSAWADGGEYAAATVQTDKTLLVEDRAADAKATGEAVGELKTQLNQRGIPTGGSTGQSLRKKSGTNYDMEWADVGLPTDEQTADAVSAWLDEHPEATTTVQDDSLTEAKFTDELKLKTVKDYVTPEMFGAKGDGSTDDTLALSSALNSGKPVFLANKVYCISNRIIGSANIIKGDGATIKLTADFSAYNALQFSDNLIFSGVIFDANGNNVNGFIMINAENNANPVDVELSDIIIDGVQDNNSSTLTSLLNIYYCRNVSVNNIYITNCTKLSDGTPSSGAGGLTGIRVQYLQGNLLAEKLYVKNFYNVNSGGDIVIDDADSIFCLAVDEKSNCKILNSVFYNGGKRAIKIQSINPAFVSGIYAYNDTPALVNLITMQSQVIDGTNIAGDGTITSCVLIDKASTGAGGSGIAVSGSAKISDCFIDFSQNTNNKCILIGNDTTIENCTLKGNISGTISTSKNLNIYNSTIIVDGINANGIQYSSTSSVGNVQIKNTVFKSLSADTLSTCGYFESNTNVILDGCEINGSFTFYSKSVLITNCVINVDNDNVSFDRIFKLYGSGTFKVDGITHLISSGITQSGKTLIFVPNGQTPTLELSNIKESSVFKWLAVTTSSALVDILQNVNLTKISCKNTPSVKNIPTWVDSLPVTTELASGVYCLLLTDGKLYQNVSGTWTQV